MMNSEDVAGGFVSGFRNTAVPQYIFRYADPDGKVAYEEVRQYDNDRQATDAAGMNPHPYRLEVWQGDRWVASFPPLLPLRT
jgi:hypothetical protein